MVVGDSEITAKQTVTYLGCILDNTLTGEGMAVKVIAKINLRIQFLPRISHLIDRKALEILAGALVQGHFDFACTSWCRQKYCTT